MLGDDVKGEPCLMTSDYDAKVLLGNLRDTNDVADRGLILPKKGNSQSCQRVNACVKIASSSLLHQKVVKLKRKQKRIQLQRAKRLEAMDDASTCLALPVAPGVPSWTEYGRGLKPELMESVSVFYVNFYDDPVLEDLYEEDERKKIVLMPCLYKMKFLDSTKGCKLFESNGKIPVFLLIPRDEAIKRMGSPGADVRALRDLLQRYKKKNIRGIKRSGLSTEYATIGLHSPQGGLAVSKLKRIRETDIRTMNHLKKMLARADDLAKRYFPNGLLKTLQKMKDKVGDTAQIDNVKADNVQNLWASVATSFNYISPAHVDDDCFLSSMTVSYSECENDVGGSKERYRIDMSTAVYFLLPEYSIALELRPGDVLFFNPLHYHCVSQRLMEYRHKEVFVTSFYMKTKQLGLNNNQIPFQDNSDFENLRVG